MWMVGRPHKGEAPWECFGIRAKERGHQYKCKPRVQDQSVLTHCLVQELKNGFLSRDRFFLKCYFILFS